MHVLGLASLWISERKREACRRLGFSVYLHCYLGRLIQRNMECLYLEGLPILGLRSIRQTRPVSRPFIYLEFFCGLLRIMGFAR
jgi:hypothetical protein